MNEQSCFFKLPDGRGMYLVGGYRGVSKDVRLVRTTFCFAVGSVSDMYAKMKEKDVDILQSEPADMGNDYWWFQMYDPSHNVVEIIGGK